MRRSPGWTIKRPHIVSCQSALAAMATLVAGKAKGLSSLTRATCTRPTRWACGPDGRTVKR
eukprot:15656600-Heterocapsa_arctica.AAC.1